jgi:hypothetical protein
MYNMSFPAGQWNSYDITVQGTEVKVEMNGWLIIHTYLDKMTMPLGKFSVAYASMPKEGYIYYRTMEERSGIEIFVSNYWVNFLKKYKEIC